MTCTRFAPGTATAYVSADVIAVFERAGADPELMRICADPPGWDALVATLAGHADAAVVTTDDGVRAAVVGAMTVLVDDPDGRRRVDGTTEVVTHRFPAAHTVGIASPDAVDVDPAFCVAAGSVPVSIVTRAVTGGDASVDVFDSLFGRTVERSVEQAAVRAVDAGPGRRRAPFGVLVFSNGERVIADRTVVLGRNPRRRDEGGAPAASRPRCVTLAAPSVSRQHAVVHVDGWRVAIDDLGSSNGTWVTSPGGEPGRVHVGRPVELVPGAVVDLGGGVSFAVEEIA